MGCGPVQRIAGVLAAILLCLGAASADADGVSLSFSTGTGVMYGMAKEFALDNGFAISELDWTIQPLVFVENTVDLRALGGLHASVRVRTGLPMYSGQMTDSDWLNYDVNGDTSTKTNFSQSDCFTERAVLVDARIGWEFPLGSRFSIEPFAAFGYMSWAWTARDGYYRYPPGFPSSPPPYPEYTQDPKAPIYGTGIFYTQTWLIPAAGFTITYAVSGSVRLGISVSASPYVYCVDQDDHIFNGAEYYDVMGGGWMIEPELSAEVQLASKIRLSAEASFRHVAQVIGDDTLTYTSGSSSPGSQATFTNGGGASFDAFSVRLTLAVAL